MLCARYGEEHERKMKQNRAKNERWYASGECRTISTLKLSPLHLSTNLSSNYDPSLKS
jgi:hypothetical protein